MEERLIMSNFFTDRGFDPLNNRNLFGQSLYGSGAPTFDQSNFYGLAGSPQANSDDTRRNVFAGLQNAYKGANAPSSLRRWLQFQEPDLTAGWQNARLLEPSLDYAGFVGRQNIGDQWDRLAPSEAGRWNGYIRSRYG